MTGRIIKAVIIMVVVLACLVLLGSIMLPSTQWMEATYTVKPGDRLWDIALELNVKNWEKWSYEVCKRNDIPLGGLIHPGDEIVVFLEVE